MYLATLPWKSAWKRLVTVKYVWSFSVVGPATVCLRRPVGTFAGKIAIDQEANSRAAAGRTALSPTSVWTAALGLNKCWLPRTRSYHPAGRNEGSWPDKGTRTMCSIRLCVQKSRRPIRREAGAGQIRMLRNRSARTCWSQKITTEIG